MSNMDRQVVIDLFIEFCCSYLGITRPSNIEFIEGSEFPETHRTFGTYNPEKRNINISVHGRHLMDVMRTLAHELVHYRQFTYRNTWNDSDIPQLESEANTVAAIIMREYAKKYPQLFSYVAEEAPVNSVGSGSVTGMGIGPQGEPGFKKKLKSYKLFTRGKK